MAEEAPWCSEERKEICIKKHAGDHKGEETYLLEVQNAYDAIMAWPEGKGEPVPIARRTGVIEDPQPGDGDGNMIYVIQMSGSANRTIGLTDKNQVFHYSKEGK